MNKAVVLFVFACVVLVAILLASLAPVKKVVNQVTNAAYSQSVNSNMSGDAITTNNGPLNQWWDSMTKKANNH